ncbi:Protein kinase [Quillaja saponaria]|uniref:Protein kinase n=1 Tax=Quillaja saponaria TaxID=32244 RepID=A0AAD7KKS4_QUISA|nr:Protein kinase [Quillaja saponaria]
MDRSPRFGSISSDNCPMKTRFRYGFRWVPLTKPLPMSRRLILQQHAVRAPGSSHCLGAYGFMFYFTPRWGFFSPFPHGTTSLSVTQEYLALQVVLADSHGIPRAPCYSGQSVS